MKGGRKSWWPDNCSYLWDFNKCIPGAVIKIRTVRVAAVLNIYKFLWEHSKSSFRQLRVCETPLLSTVTLLCRRTLKPIFVSGSRGLRATPAHCNTEHAYSIEHILGHSVLWHVLMFNALDISFWLTGWKRKYFFNWRPCLGGLKKILISPWKYHLEICVFFMQETAFKS